jgi:hypothetical protein
MFRVIVLGGIELTAFAGAAMQMNGCGGSVHAGADGSADSDGDAAAAAADGCERDAGVEDALSQTDAARPDGGGFLRDGALLPDAGGADAGVADAGGADAGVADAGVADAATDAWFPQEAP